MRKKMFAGECFTLYLRAFYIAREILLLIVVKNIDIFETFKEVGTSISNPNRK